MGPRTSNLTKWLEHHPLLAAFGALFLILFTVAMAAFFVDSRIERLEDTLRYGRSVELPTDDGSEFTAEPGGGQLLYVPAYSHIYSRGGEANLLEITLSVRNTDLDQPITLVAVDYYDTGGKRVRQFLERPTRLAPLATT